LQAFAERHPKISFIHAHPGFVKTNLLSGSTSPLLRVAGPITKLIPMGKTPLECGAFMWQGLLKAPQGGSMRMGENGEDVGLKNYQGTADARQRLWEHTVAVTETK
jgi:hypothetical protein